MKKILIPLILFLLIPLQNVFAVAPNEVTYDTHGVTSEVASQSAYDTFKNTYLYGSYYINSSGSLYILGHNTPIAIVQEADGIKITTQDSQDFKRLNPTGTQSSFASGIVISGALGFGVQWFPAPPDTEKPVVTSSLANGTYSESKQVTLSVNETATIYYSVDGSTPTVSSSVYSNPILIDKTTTLKYFAKDTAGNSSEVVIQTFTIELPSDRDGDGIYDSSDLYPDDPTNTPPASDESSEADKKTQSIMIMIFGLILTSVVMGGKGLL